MITLFRNTCWTINSPNTNYFGVQSRYEKNNQTNIKISFTKTKFVDYHELELTKRKKITTFSTLRQKYISCFTSGVKGTLSGYFPTFWAQKRHKLPRDDEILEISLHFNRAMSALFEQTTTRINLKKTENTLKASLASKSHGYIHSMLRKEDLNP